MVRIATVLLAVAFLIPTTASADWKPNLKFGKLELHPFAALKWTYDDNIYLRSGDNSTPSLTQSRKVVGSGITDATAGLAFKFPFSDMHQFMGGYKFQGLVYNENGESNDGVNQTVNAGYKYKGPMGISGKLSDTYMNTQDPASSELTDRETRWQNTGSLSAEYGPKSGKLFAGVFGDFVTHKYVNQSMGALLDRNEATFGVKTGYKVFPKTRVYAKYGRQLIKYIVDQYVSGSTTYDAKNNKSHMFNFGVEGKIVQKLTGQVETGWSIREYDGEDNGRTGLTRNWIVTSKLAYKPLKRCEFGLSYKRSLQESTYSNNRFYVGNSAALSLKHKFPYKLTGRASVGMGIDKYPEGDETTGSRRDDIYTKSIGVDYDIQKWLGVSLDYTHREKNSTDTANFDYENSITSLGVKAMF
ncbi:outer membrane beta-barrel protein [Elusimicrobiota bacterium]